MVEHTTQPKLTPLMC